VSEVRTIPTSYLVTAWPEGEDDHPDAHHWCVTVQYRGPGKWAVLQGDSGSKFCLGTDGEWDYEPSPSNREDDWLATHRFDLERALELAREHAPKIRINNFTTLDCIAWHREREAQS
jgi:hypothetical protein